jgi:hypothetical protein
MLLSLLMTSFAPQFKGGDRLGNLAGNYLNSALAHGKQKIVKLLGVLESEYRNSPMKRACVVPNAKATSGKPYSLN